MLQQIIRFPLVRLILASLILLVGVATVQSFAIQPLHAMTSLDNVTALVWQSIYLISSILIAFGCYLTYTRFFERRQAVEVSSAGAIRMMSVGGVIGGALFAGVLIILWLFGAFHANLTLNWPVLVTALALNITGAVVEELLLRGILLRIVEEALGTWLALAASVLVFGLLHAGDAPTAAVMIALAGGLLPSAAYILTRRIWLPIGIHAGWDILQNLVFGLTFAGHPLLGLMHVQLSGPALLTGGSAGPEGSIIALVVCLAASSFMLMQARQRGRMQQPFWYRKRASAVILSS